MFDSKHPYLGHVSYAYWLQMHTHIQVYMIHSPKPI